MLAIDYNPMSSVEQRAASAFVESLVLNEDFPKAITPVSNDILLKKLADLKIAIGDELYMALNDEDRLFMAETAGTIDFGHPIDLDVVARNIKEYGDTE